MTASGRRFHYGWHIVWSGALAIFACLGLGRFALGMLLPAMGESLGLSYAQMGLISTINFTGYLLAVLSCGYLVSRLGYRMVITIGLAMIGTTMLLMGKSDSVYIVLPLYFLTGIGSAIVNVPIMALVSLWFTRRSRGRATGFVVIGSGFAILLAGKLIPVLNAWGGEEGWRWGWMTLGAIVLIATVICFRVIRNSPSDLGISPCGEQAENGPKEVPAAGDYQKTVSLKDMGHMGAIYFLFGSTYVVFVTFFVTSLVRDRGLPEMSAGNFWSSVGALSLLSGPIFGTLSDRAGRKTALIAVFSIQAVAYALAGSLNLPGYFIYVSILCFGITAWSIPSIMAALVGDKVSPLHSARVFGIITFIFSLGQISGPAVAGMLAEHSGSFSSSFMLTAGLALLGAIFAAMLEGRR